MENHFKIAEEAKVWLNSFPSNDILFYGNLIWAIHHHPVGDDSQKFDDVLQQQRQRHQLGLNEQKRIFDEQMAEEKSKFDVLALESDKTLAEEKKNHSDEIREKERYITINTNNTTMTAK